MSLRKSFSCAWVEFNKWLFDSRMLVMIILIIFIYVFAVDPLLNNARLMGEKLNMLEPFIAISNSGAILLIVPVVFLTLISDYPRIDTNTAFFISRVGRKSWLLGQIIKLVFCAISYLAIIFLGAVIPMIGKGFWGNDWSRVALEFTARFPEKAGNFGVQLLPDNLYNQMEVILAAVESYLMVFLYLIVIGLIMLFFSLVKSKGIGFVVCGMVISLGTALCAVKSQLMWIMPMANSIIWLHYTSYYSTPIVLLWYSEGYMCGLIALFILLSSLAIKRFDYDNVMEVTF